MDYLKRLFSWNGEAGRKEMLGFTVFSCLMPAGISICCIIFFSLLGLFGIKAELPNAVMALFFLLGAACYICAAARRLRHIGWAPYWAFLTLLTVLPAVRLIVVAGQVALLFIPPLKNPSPRPNPLSYMGRNIAVSVLTLAIPALLVMGLAMIAKKSPRSLANFPAVKEAINQKSAKQKQTKEQSDTLPPVMQKLWARKQQAGQQSAHMLQANDTAQQAGQKAPSLPAPNAVSLTEQIAWNPVPRSCGQDCFQFISRNGQWTLNLTKDDKTFVQNLQGQQGLLETILYSTDGNGQWLIRRNGGKITQMLYRRDKGNVFFYKINPDSYQREAELINPMPTARQAELSFIIFPDGRYQLFRFYPDRNPPFIYYPLNTFSGPWNGFSVSRRFIDKAFKQDAIAPTIK